MLFADGKQLPRTSARAQMGQTALARVDRALAQLGVRPEIVITSASGVMVSQMGGALMALLIFGNKLPETIALQKERKWAAMLPDLCSPWNCAAVRLALSATGPSGGSGTLAASGREHISHKRDLMRLEDSGYTPEGLGDPGGQYFKRLYRLRAEGYVEGLRFVVLTLPLTPETKRSRRGVWAMKPAHYLVNISAGIL